MASIPPPFQVEDNTDEDFFDRLVNDDDDDFKVACTMPASLSFADGNELDEAKAFANLTINEVENNPYDDDGSSNNKGNHNDLGRVFEKVENSEKLGPVDGIWKPLVSLDSFEFDSSTQNGNGNGEGQVLSNVGKSSGESLSDMTMVSKSSGEGLPDANLVSEELGSSGARQVDWSAFNSDSAQGDVKGFGSYSDFFTGLEGDDGGHAFGNVNDDFSTEAKDYFGDNKMPGSAAVGNSEQYHYGAVFDQTAGEQDMNNSQYWESLYPGWKYDPISGQWYQVDSNEQANVDTNSTSSWGFSGSKADVSYLQQSAQSVSGTLADIGKIENVTNWNQAAQLDDAITSTTNWSQVSQVNSDTAGVASDWSLSSQGNDGYPSHMVFDPQYPGWYYDTITQEWCNLESYTTSAQSAAHTQHQSNQTGHMSKDAFPRINDQKTYGAYDQVTDSVSQGISNQDQIQNWTAQSTNYSRNSSIWQPGYVAKSESSSHLSGIQENLYGENISVDAHGAQQRSGNYGGMSSHDHNVHQNLNDFSMQDGSQRFSPGGNFSQQLNHSGINQNVHKHVESDYYSSTSIVNFSQQHIQSASQFSYAPAAGRSPAGRPPHALVTFGFGGKLILMKDNSSSIESSVSGSLNSAGGSISVLNLAEVVNDNDGASNLGIYETGYFQALCRQPLPGPLGGGSVGIKELNKWIDDRIANLQSADMDFRKGNVSRLLLSLLKIACQYYGKLRSPFGTDSVLKENDAPESAVAKLFASAKRNSTQYDQYGAVNPCLQQIPSEAQLQVTAAEVQNLLVSGRKREALQSAQDGQLWGPALVLAAQLGDQFYVETVKQMALSQLVSGSPLRTLCLLIAGQPADVFSANTTSNSSLTGALNFPEQPVQYGANSMLDDWEENLAVITANRTKDDELVLVHLGDCLWKDRSDIIAAHICYLVAEKNFESYSDNARLCLVGADHWKFPRTYASPEAIQRTEIYEHSKTLGNSQFVLLPFQPYKLVYAYMLAEVGRISDAMKYCQAVLKSLKTGRSPEVEALRQLVSSLEERIKAHQQGGFSTNLAPAKLVGKLLNLFDSTAHRVVGGLPPPVPTTGGTIYGNEHHHQTTGPPRVSTSQSTMAMSSLIPSQSVDPISELAADENRMAKHTRSVSEPDFGRSPRQGASSISEQDKASAGGGASRFGRFGFGSQLLQKTVGLVLKPRQGRQAKLGDKNKFYYDEKLKRWVEEGAELQAEEPALPPPPTTAVFQNGTPDYNLKNALQSEAPHVNGSLENRSPSALDNNPGMPPLPPVNQYSSRARMGVRSRYVDTFNKGGGNQLANSFQSPAIASSKPATGANPKFFMPTPISNVDQPIDSPANSIQDISSSSENPSSSPANDLVLSPAPPSSSSMQRFASMGDMSNKVSSASSSFSAHSRRTASWSGSFSGSLSPPTNGDAKPPGEVFGMHPSSFVRSGSPLVHSQMSGGNFGDDLHEVEL